MDSLRGLHRSAFPSMSRSLFLTAYANALGLREAPSEPRRPSLIGVRLDKCEREPGHHQGLNPSPQFRNCLDQIHSPGGRLEKWRIGTRLMTNFLK